MRKKLSILSIVIVLLLAQAFSLAHIAKYGLDPHKHNGKSCEIFLNSEQSKITFFDNPANNLFVKLFVLENDFFENKLVLQNTSNPYSSQAPPLFY